MNDALSPFASRMPRIRPYHSSAPRPKRATRGRVVHPHSVAWWAVAASALFGPTMTGCGRRATQLDCQLIVDKSVELELRQTNQTSADAIEKREEQVRGELQDEIKSCEGRRVTEQTMACVHAATTTQELDACLR